MNKFILVKDINAAEQLKKYGYRLLNESNGLYLFENKDEPLTNFASIDPALYTFTNRMFL